MIERRKRRHLWEYKYKNDWHTCSELFSLPECKIDKPSLSARLCNYFRMETCYQFTFDTVEKCLQPPIYDTQMTNIKEESPEKLKWLKDMSLMNAGSLAYTVK